MVENRRYSQHELKYVLSRILANWKPEVIAKAFKRDHAPYWDDKVFTKKQISYIKNTYRGPPGSVQPYAGPVPEFTPSPPQSPHEEAASLPKMDRDGNMSEAQNEAPNTQNSLNDFFSMMSPAVDNQGQMILGGQQEVVPEMTEDDMNQYFDFDQFYNEPAAPTSSGDGPSSAGPSSSQTAATSFMTETGTGDKTGGAQSYSLDNELLDFDVFMGFVPQFQDDNIQNPQLSPQGAPGNDAPLPSVECVQPDQFQGDAIHNGPVGSSFVQVNVNGSPQDTSSSMLENNNGGGVDNSVNNGVDNCVVQLPDGFTHHNFVALDDFGWKYSGAHDTCAIACAHRHEGDGGVFFADYEALMAWVRVCQQGGDVVSQNSLLNMPCVPAVPAVDNNQKLLGASVPAQSQVLAAPAYASNPYQSNGNAASSFGGLQQNLGFAGGYGQQDLNQQTMSPYGMGQMDLAPIDNLAMIQKADMSQPQPNWWAMDPWSTAVANGSIDPRLIMQQAAYESQNPVQQAQETTAVMAQSGFGAADQQGVTAQQTTAVPSTTAVPNAVAPNKQAPGSGRLQSRQSTARSGTGRSGAARPTAAGASRPSIARVNKAGASTTAKSSDSPSGGGSGNGGRRRHRAVDPGDDDFDFLNPAV